MALIEQEALLTALNSDDALKHARHLIWLYVQEAPTIDPVRAAGGCYCRECRRCDGFPGPEIEQEEVGICKLTGFTVHAEGWCKWSEPREAQDNG